MKTNLIVGAGQLGSRHLQGLLNYKLHHQRLFVLDPFQKSLDIAKIRASEIESSHEIRYTLNWDELPEEFDLVIVATNADVREDVVIRLLQSCKVKFLILEKVLFQNLNSYNRIARLLEKKNVKTWVNHPRRMYKSYRELKKQLAVGQTKNYQITGGSWGLGCNALHFIDLFAFLSESQVKTIDAEWVDSTILESKRKGFIEFTGSIKGELNNSSTFQISSLKGEISAGTITIFENDKRYIIQESGTPQIITMKQENQFKPEFSTFTLEFQSGLTTIFADKIFNFGYCDLPTYNEAMQIHKIFITALLKKYNSITGLNSKSLPIT